MQQTFKQFNLLIEEALQEAVAAEPELYEGLGDSAARFTSLIAKFIAKFKRKPTPQEAAELRKALRAELDRKEQLFKKREAEKLQAPHRPEAQRGPSMAAKGKAAERDWVQNLLSDA